MALHRMYDNHDLLSKKESILGHCGNDHLDTTVSFPLVQPAIEEEIFTRCGYARLEKMSQEGL